jgi:hypothetical protein
MNRHGGSHVFCQKRLFGARERSLLNQRNYKSHKRRSPRAADFRAHTARIDGVLPGTYTWRAFNCGRNAMSIQEYAPYRGCRIEVNVTLSKTHWLGGKYRRYRVSWTVTLPGNPEQELVSFPEQFDFLTEREAFRYGENRAHTYIDSIMSTPSRRRALPEAVVQHGTHHDV